MTTEREIREEIQRLERQEARVLTYETLQKNRREAVKLWVWGFALCVTCVLLSVLIVPVFIIPLIPSFVVTCWAALNTADAVGDIEEFERKERLDNGT